MFLTFPGYNDMLTPYTKSGVLIISHSQINCPLVFLGYGATDPLTFGYFEINITLLSTRLIGSICMQHCLQASTLHRGTPQINLVAFFYMNALNAFRLIRKLIDIL